jgi:pimeloyl-ACP methyl ester carboxylesterase
MGLRNMALGRYAAVIALAAPTVATSQVQPFPASFSTRDIASNGAVIHVRVGGKGPAVLLLHGFGDTGDMWAPMAANLVRDHTVIVPDLRGMGLSSHPDGGYDKKNEAADIAGVLDTLKVGKVDIVAHDIGNMVGFAFTARYPSRVGKLVLTDAPVPGIANWDQLSHAPKTWHFYFYGPDEERLVAGRERIYLDRFYNEFSANPAKVNEGIREHYAALYARPHAMHDAFEQFKAFRRMQRTTRHLSGTASFRHPCWRSVGRNPTAPDWRTWPERRLQMSRARSFPTPGIGSWRSSQRPLSRPCGHSSRVDRP